MIEYLLVKVCLSMTAFNGLVYSCVNYYTVIKKECDNDTTFCYYILCHSFKSKKILNKNLVSWLLGSGKYSLFDYYDTDSDFIKSLAENTGENTTITVVLRYNLQ